MPALRSLLRFVRPHRTARRVPLGRLTIATQLVAVLIFLVYTLDKMDFRLPLLSNTYEVEVILPDGSGLDEEDEPPAAVAGTLQGRVVEVRYEDGKAIAKLRMDEEVRGKIFRDASARVRPINSIQQLVVNIDPGTRATGELPERQAIPPDRTETYVATDRILEVLDSDTRAWVQILIAEAERGLRDRPGELRAALRELGPLTDSTARAASALADRRRLLTRLVRELDVIFATLGERGEQLREVVDAGSRTFAITSARERDLAQIFRELGPTLAEADRALGGVRKLAVPLNPALERLRPTARALPAGLRSAREFVPTGRALLRDVDALAREGRAPVRALRDMVSQLEPAAAALRSPVSKLHPVLQPLDEDKEGIGQIVDNWSGILSTNDANGVRTRGITLKYEDTKTENFGLPPAAGQRNGRAHSELEIKVAAAMEKLCRDVNSIACAVRWQIPGLPEDLVSMAELRRVMR